MTSKTKIKANIFITALTFDVLKQVLLVLRTYLGCPGVDAIKQSFSRKQKKNIVKYFRSFTEICFDQCYKAFLNCRELFFPKFRRFFCLNFTEMPA